MWGPRAHPDALANFFIQSFARKNLLDIVPPKVSPTWRNKRVGDQRVAKRLDRFLVAEVLANGVEVVRQWVGSGGISDHNPILSQELSTIKNLPTPIGRQSLPLPSGGVSATPSGESSFGTSTLREETRNTNIVFDTSSPLPTGQ